MYIVSLSSCIEEARLCRADLESETSHIGWVKHHIYDQLFGPFWYGIGYGFCRELREYMNVFIVLIYK